MNTIESITKKILDDAKSAAQEKTLEAQKEAEAVLKDYANQADQIKSEAVKAAEKEAFALLERVASQSDLARRNLQLRYKRKTISRAFETALDGLCGLDAERQLDFLSSFAAKYQSGTAEVLLNEGDKANFGTSLVSRIQEKLKASGKDYSVSLSGKTGNFAGGMVLVEGSIETNCSYEILIKNIRDDLEGEVAKTLYE